jgi:inorganic triphosphatase YgiF
MTSAPIPDDKSLAIAHASRECEIKLNGPAHVLRNLKTHPAFAHAIAKPRAVNLRAVYFDTAEGDLARNGLSLRIRKAGRRRTMNVKWVSEGDGAFTRGESEVAISGDLPDLTLLAPEAASHIQRAVKDAGLQPVFETSVRRKLMELVDGQSIIEIAFDEGKLIAGGSSEPVSEIEIELKSGPQGPIYALALQLIDAGLRLAPATKSARGYLLSAGGKAQDVRAAPLSLPADASMEEALVAMIESSLSHFMSNWPGLLISKAPEAIHQMRVALRRLRAGLKMFARALPGAGLAPFRDQARDIASALGQAREIDAFVDLVQAGPLTQFAQDASFDALLAHAQTLRASAYEAAHASLNDAKTSRFVLELQAYCARRGWRNDLAGDDLAALTSPLRIFAAQALSDLDKRVQKRGKRLRKLTPDDRHELRIALKNMRYGADFLCLAFNDARAVRAFLKRAAALQDDLGVYNDSIAACLAAATIEREAGPAAAYAAGRIEGWCARGAHASDDHLRKAFKAFRDAPRFWR